MSKSRLSRTRVRAVDSVSLGFSVSYARVYARSVCMHTTQSGASRGTSTLTTSSLLHLLFTLASRRRVRISRSSDRVLSLASLFPAAFQGNARKCARALRTLRTGRARTWSTCVCTRRQAADCDRGNWASGKVFPTY